jgi:ubiquitin-protein ligase E3 C
MYLDAFWTILRGMSQENKEKFLLFVTGTNRPPLLGFKYLNPPLLIYKSHNDGYPTSSTCSNMLKLPFFGMNQQGYTRLKETLIEAINSNSGFYNA